MNRLITGIINENVRFFALDSTEMVRKAQRIHETSEVSTAALGRMLTAGSLMGRMLKNEKDALTLQVRSDGEIHSIVVVSWSSGNVKGYVESTDCELMLKGDGKLDVGSAVGNGEIIVVRDFGLKEPYIGKSKLVTGEIAEDIANYYMESEQQPSVVSLGVLLDESGTVKSSSGVIIQLMPDATEEEIVYLEERLGYLSDISRKTEKGNIAEFLKAVFGDKLRITDESDVDFVCDCSRERMKGALVTLGMDELHDMIENDHGAELGCHFCNSKYEFSEEDLLEIISEL